MKKTAKIAIFNSILAIMLCLVMMCGATFAIFSTESVVNIAITSGTVRVVATPSITAASSQNWSDTASDYVTKDCSPANGNNVATFTNGGTVSIVGKAVRFDNITPGDSATVQIAIANYSTIKIKYQLTATFGGETNLLDLLTIDLDSATNPDLNIFDGNFSHSGTAAAADKASNWVTMDPAADPATPSTETLTLAITFPLDFSLEAMSYAGATANITLAIYAVQWNTHTDDPTPPTTHEVAPTEPFTVGASEVGSYKVLEAQTVAGYEFLYWAFKPSSTSGIAKLAANTSSTDYGTYVSNNPVYKFRVTAETCGTYRAVYRDSATVSHTVRLTAASSTYTVPTDAAVGSEITLIAETDSWSKFTYFTKNDGEPIYGGDRDMYTFTVGENDRGAVYAAQYAELDMDEYFDYFDNTGSINYEAEIVESNIPRVHQDYGCGGIDGKFEKGEFKGAGDEFADKLVQPDDYPIYGKGYTKYPNKAQYTSQSDYKQNNKLVFDETKALSEVGNYFIDEDGKLWEGVIGQAGVDWSSEEAREEFYNFQYSLNKKFCEQYRSIIPEFDNLFDEDGNFNETAFYSLVNSEPEPEWYKQYYQDFSDEEMKDFITWVEVGHLYKHREAQNMYLGDVADSQPAVEKKISATPRGTTKNWSPTITGLYAPAGEVITFKVSEEVMERTGGLTVTIGMVQMPGLPLIFGVEKYPVRPARITAQTTITPNTKHPNDVQFYDEAKGEYTFYFGSYLGGPIYISTVNPGEPFTVDIRGGVEYQHYIYGVTTEQEFESRKDTTAPYFECWVSTEDVRFVGPYSQVKNFTYENYVKVSRLWENAARISKRFPSQSNSEYGIMVMFETYVQSGAACAFAGANTVDSPYGWMGGALSYESIVEYGGWGNFHEFNHCYQYFGIGADSEVSNNSVNLVEYALLTEISAHRAVDADGISTRYTGWESYTDPAFALRVLTGGNPANGSRDKNLCRYVNLFYAFGLDRYVEMTQITSHNGGQIWGSSKGAYPFFKGACEGSGYNMEYYFNQILFPESDEAYKKYHINLNDSFIQKDYEQTFSKLPTFVPVACTYQTGVGYAFDPDTGNGVNACTETQNVQWEYTTTSRPFRIDFNKAFTLDFEKTLALPGRSKASGWQDTQFTWSIKPISDPAYGTLTTGEGRNFIYTPNDAARAAGTSGSMIFLVTYEGKADTPAANIKGSVQIVVQFDATPGTTRVYDLDRTTYTFTEGIEEDKNTEGGEGSEGVAAVAETKSPFETEYDKWFADLGNSTHTYDGSFSGALYVTTEGNVIPETAGAQNNTAVYFDEDHPAPVDSFVVVSGIYTPIQSGTYYLGIESSHKAAALYLSTDGKTYSLFVTASQNPGGGLYQDGSVYRVAKQYQFVNEKPVYFREVLAIDPEASENRIKMIWGQTNYSVGELSDRLENPADPHHLGCAYCVKDNSTSYELEYLETRDQNVLEKVTATQERVDVAYSGFKIDETDRPGYTKTEEKYFFDGDPYTSFIVNGSSGKLTIIGKMSESVTADSFTLRTDADKDPHSFKLYVGNTEEVKSATAELVFEQNWNEYGSRPRLQRTGILEYSFKNGEETFQYYRLEITQASSQVILYGIDFGTRWNVKQPSDRDVEKLGAWDNVRTHGSTFGYLITANGKTEKEPYSSLTVKFEGEHLLIRALAGKRYGVVEVVIDGKCVADIDLSKVGTKEGEFKDNEFQIIFNSDVLKEGLTAGPHTLTLRSLESFNVDAIIYR